MYDTKDVQEFMNLAIEEAKKSCRDVPVGALIVKNKHVISKGFNQKELQNDATLHAEIIAIKQASNLLGNWRLKGTSLFVTLEPCPMCAAAILYSRVENIYFGAYDPLYGAFGSVTDLRNLIKFQCNVTGGILEQECGFLLKEFFKEKRKYDT